MAAPRPPALGGCGRRRGPEATGYAANLNALALPIARA